MISTSIAIKLYWDSFIDLYESNNENVNDLLMMLINIIYKIKSHFTDPNNWSSITEKNNEELELINDISNYWCELYQQPFKEIEEEQIMLELKNADYLQTIINQELTNKSQILILVERKVKAQLITELVRKFTSTESIARVEGQINISTYFGSSFQNFSEIDDQIENFKKKLAPGCTKFDWNVEPFINIAKLIASEDLIFEKFSESYADTLLNFKTGKSQILISTVFDEDMVSQPNTRIILCSEKSFLMVPFAPSVLLNEANILLMQNNRKEEALNKIKRIDLLIKEKYDMLQRSIRERNRLTSIIESNKRMFNFKKKGNSVIGISFDNPANYFENLVL